VAHTARETPAAALVSLSLRILPGFALLLLGTLPCEGAEAGAQELALVPAPARVVLGGGYFELSARTTLAARSAEAQPSVAYFAQLLASTRALKLAPANTSSAAADILFELRAGQGSSPEGYRLEVSARRIRVSATDARGLLYGAVTLWQLATASDAQPIRIPALRIEDVPRFPWRALMLDSARHMQSVDFILHYLDWMALHKLNVLSWHLTDDQGWRLEIKRYPRLTEVGAWRVPAGRAAQHDIDPATGRPRLYGGFYTQPEVRRIVAYAAARNVTIVPEIDVPGHSTAAIVAYPQLGVLDRAPPVVPADWGIYPNLLNVEESTFTFLEDVLDEVMALFPGRYINLGGDEAVKDQWQTSARVQARMRELHVQDEAALQGYFTARLAAYLRDHGRTAAGWDEILAAGVPPQALVLSWRGVQGAIRAAAAGHDTVLSPDPALYLDNRQGSGPQEPPGRGRLITLADVYHFDPLPGPLAAAGQHMLGLQANLWTEHVRSEAETAYMTWPRAAALAEVAWSPGARLDWESFQRRLPGLFARYRSLGIEYATSVFAPRRELAPTALHMSQDLKSCTDRVLLALEGDAPLIGPRPVFLIDIMNPCWILPAVDLTSGPTLTAAVGQVPFNFQLGKDLEKIHLETPATPAGELKVRADGCEGEPLAVLPLASAAGSEALTTLPAARLPARPGAHDLCLRFTQTQLDPLWALGWVQVSP
jgi:hexosaminidase